MKAKFVLIITALILIGSSAVDAQKPCKFKKGDCDFSDDEAVDIFGGEFDYRSQSAYAQLSPGDVQEVRFVVYRGKDYRIFTCQDYELGELHLQIIKPERRTETVIEKINVSEEQLIKLDEDGNEVWDDVTGEPIMEMRKVYDTIWKTNNWVEEIVWFDSKNNKEDTKIFKLNDVKKTTSLRARVSVPELGAEGSAPDADIPGDYVGCASVLIGFRHHNYNTFVRGATSAGSGR